MKSFATFLSVSAVLATAAAGGSEWRTLRKWADMKAYEQCFGEDVIKQYTVNMKKAVAKCHNQDAPELNLPPFRSHYRFVNTLLSSADAMDQNKMEFMYNMMNKMNKYHNGHNNEFSPFSDNYSSDSWMEKMMKQMMMKKMMNKFEMMFEDNSNSYGHNNNYHSSNVAPTKYMADMYNSNSNNFDEKSFMESMMKYKMMNSGAETSGSNYRQKMMEILSRNKRQANKNNKKDSAVTLPSTLDIGDRLTEKVKSQQQHVQEKIGNMTCVLREIGMITQENQLEERTMKNFFNKFDLKNKWLVDRINNDIEMCVDVAKNLPEDYQEEMNFPGYVNVAQIKYFMKCFETSKMKSCMYNDVKEKVEANFGPLKEILEQTQMTENQFLPLVMSILHGDETDFDF